MQKESQVRNSSIRRKTHPVRKLVSRILICTTALLSLCIYSSAHANINFPVRWVEMWGDLKKDGYDLKGTNYYNDLVARLKSDPENINLNKLKYYCEVLPACRPRDVYVIMIWGAGGSFTFTDLKTDGYTQYSPVHNRLHDSDVEGAYLIGFWDNFFAKRDKIQVPQESWPIGSAWEPGLAQLVSYVQTIPSTSKLIIAGVSLGGGTAVTLAGRLASANRSIDHLLLFDPVGAFGWRQEAIAHTIPSNVKQFFNIWQEKGCWPADYSKSGRFHIENTTVTTQRQVKFDGGSDAGDCINSASKSVHSDTWRHKLPGDKLQRIQRELSGAIDLAMN